jgi:hypothetical protein
MRAASPSDRSTPVKRASLCFLWETRCFDDAAALKVDALDNELSGQSKGFGWLVQTPSKRPAQPIAQSTHRRRIGREVRLELWDNGGWT